MCEDYKSDDAQAGKLDLEALAKVKSTVEPMLQGHLTEYNQYWRERGRKPPSEDEWYDLAEAFSDGAGEWLGAVVDDDGEEVAGPASRWLFKGPGEPFYLVFYAGHYPILAPSFRSAVF